MSKNIEIEVMDKYAVVKLIGQFTGGSETEQLENEISKITSFPHPALIIDLHDTTFISSIVIGLLVKMHAKFSELDGKLVFCNLNSTLRSVLKMTKVDSIINITDSFESAVEKINKL